VFLWAGDRSLRLFLGVGDYGCPVGVYYVVDIGHDSNYGDTIVE